MSPCDLPNCDGSVWIALLRDKMQRSFPARDAPMHHVTGPKWSFHVSASALPFSSNASISRRSMGSYDRA